jgi:PIN domain nuclease of toxin-antitoxin system
MERKIISVLAIVALLPIYANEKRSGDDVHKIVSDKVISEQRMKLAGNTKSKGYGPQSPRDIEAVAGDNLLTFNTAPLSTQMNLCNIHFHKNAEHKGGEFTQYFVSINGFLILL